MDELTWARIGLAIAVMVSASISDWRTRTASDRHWFLLGLGGSLLLGWQLYDQGAPWIYFVCLALVTLVFMDLLWDRPGMFEDGVDLVPLLLYIATILAFGYLALEHFQERYFWILVTVPILFIVFFVLYQLDVIKGGADAKSLIALALVFAVYPALEGLPLLALNDPAAQEIMPFPLLVLFNGAILTMLVPVGLFLLNLIRRDIKFPLMFLGLRMPIEEARRRHVWPMERMTDGRIKMMLFPRSDQDEDWEGLHHAGVDRPWVTPKVPFLIPLTMAVPFSLLVGNLLLYLMGA